MFGGFIKSKVKMNMKAAQAIFLTLLGCMLNNVFLEFIIKYAYSNNDNNWISILTISIFRLDPGAGHLITFSQFLFIAIHGFIFTSKFGTVQPKISLKYYLILVVLFFTTSVVNNWAFAFNIPVPLHMIFRAVSFPNINLIKQKIIKLHFRVPWLQICCWE